MMTLRFCTRRMVSRGVWVVGVLVGTAGSVDLARAQWPGWGGSERDFHVDVTGISDNWPADGPKQVWSRPLGAGYSGIVVDGDALYTMYRDGDDEVTIALDAKSGKTIGEQKHVALVPEGMETRFGKLSLIHI